MRRHRHAKIVAMLGPASSTPEVIRALFDAGPVEAVRMMSEIITEVERDPFHRQSLEAAHPEPEATVSDVICDALRRSAMILPIAALVTYTAAGRAALRAAGERPAAPILSLTPDLPTARRLALVWGVHPLLAPDFRHLSKIGDKPCRSAFAEGFAKPGETIVITGGMPFGISGGTNLLRIAQRPLQRADAWPQYQEETGSGDRQGSGPWGLRQPGQSHRRAGRSIGMRAARPSRGARRGLAGTRAAIERRNGDKRRFCKARQRSRSNPGRGRCESDPSGLTAMARTNP